MRFALIAMVLLAASSACAQADGPGSAEVPATRAIPRPRIIISTDIPPLDVIPVKAVKPGDPPDRCSDPDDVQSMVRFLLYTNEFDVEGLLASAGTFANVANKRNILDLLDLYDQVDENLRRHDPRYPAADALRAVTWQGRSGAWGAPAVGAKAKPLAEILGESKDSEASDAIIRAVDRPDPRPVWICVWGGSREVAQAIWKVRAARSPAELERFLGKLRLYLIAKQDSTTDWLLETFPSLFIILSERNYMGMFWSMPGSDQKIADLAWADAHIRKGHGPLGAAYPRSGWDPSVPGVWEGDTPSFLYLVSAIRGVNDPEKPDQGSWGGEFVRPVANRNHWFDDPAGGRTVYQWRPEVAAEFAERAEWMVKDTLDERRPARQKKTNAGARLWQYKWHPVAMGRTVPGVVGIARTGLPFFLWHAQAAPVE